MEITIIRDIMENKYVYGIKYIVVIIIIYVAKICYGK